MLARELDGLFDELPIHISSSGLASQKHISELQKIALIYSQVNITTLPFCLNYVLKTLRLRQQASSNSFFEC